MANGEAKEVIYMTHGYKLRWGNAVGGGQQDGGELRGEKIGRTIIA